VSEVTPDPVAALARFTPAGAVDPAELLFAAGRASARTHWGWKAAVVALALSTAALGAVLVFVSRTVPSVAAPAPVPVVPPEPTLTPAPASAPAPADEPWSYRALRATDPALVPNTEPVTNLTPPREPLTVLSGRRGGLE
jgi:hypothetical protein